MPHRGWLHTRSPGLEVHLGIEHDIGRFAERLDLTPCAPGDASVTIVQAMAAGGGTRRRESVHGSTQSIWNCALQPRGHERVWVADALQAALDCVRHAGRGREQAGNIIRDVPGFTEYSR